MRVLWFSQDWTFEHAIVLCFFHVTVPSYKIHKSMDVGSGLAHNARFYIYYFVLFQITVSKVKNNLKWTTASSQLYRRVILDFTLYNLYFIMFIWTWFKFLNNVYDRYKQIIQFKFIRCFTYIINVT